MSAKSHHPVRNVTAATVTIAGGIVMVGGQPAVAADAVVTTTAGGVDALDGETSLQEAVALASGTGAAEVTFAAGVTGTITLDAPLVVGEMSLLTITGPGADVLTVTNPTGEALYFYGAGSTLTVSGLTIADSADEGITTRLPGGLNPAGASLTLSDVVLADNGSASGRDGLNVENVATVSLVRTTVTGSGDDGIAIDGATNATLYAITATGNNDEGIDITASTTVDITIDPLDEDRSISENVERGIVIDDVATLTLGNGTISNNGVLSGDQDEEGGGIYLESVADATLSDLTITDNQSKDGGGGLRIYDSTVDISDSTVSGNEAKNSAVNPSLASYGIGGGIAAFDSGITVSRVTIDENSASFGAAGIFLGGVIASFESVTIVSNTSDGYDGGLAAFGSDVTMTNSTISANVGAELSGAMFLSGGDHSIAHTTISQNTVIGVEPSAAVSLYNATLDLHHTVLSGNTGGDLIDIEPVDYPSALSGSFNLVGSDAATLLSDASNTVTDDPQLDPLADNGGPTETMRPISASPVIDAGDPAISGEPVTDQRGPGFDRKVGTIDVGAVEFVAAPGVVDLSPTAATASEADGEVVVTLTRSGGLDGDATVELTVSGGTATVDEDFTAPPTPVSMPDGIEAVEIAIPIAADELVEGDETIELTIANPATVGLGAATNSTVTIVDSTPIPTPFVVPVTPARLLDTRDNGQTIDDLSEGDGPTTAGSTTTLQVAGRGGVPADAAAVVINVTAVNPSTTGFVTVFSCDDDQPLASSLNHGSGGNLANEIVAGVSGDGDICLFTAQQIDLVVDVTGYVPSGSPYTPVTPARLLETRPGKNTVDGESESIGRQLAGDQIEVQVTGRAGVPAGAASAVLNVTAINPASTGFITVHPCLDDPPLASSLNYEVGLNRGNEIIAELSSTGSVCLFTSDETHLSVDVVGWLPEEIDYEAVTGARLLDTRDIGETIDDRFEAIGALAAGSELVLDVGGRAGIGVGVDAVAINVTAIRPAAVGFITVYDCAGEPPLASSLNFSAGQTGGSEIIAGLNAAGELCIFSSVETELTVDVVGSVVADG